MTDSREGRDYETGTTGYDATYAKVTTTGPAPYTTGFIHVDSNAPIIAKLETVIATLKSLEDRLTEIVELTEDISARLADLEIDSAPSTYYNKE